VISMEARLAIDEQQAVLEHTAEVVELPTPPVDVDREAYGLALAGSPGGSVEAAVLPLPIGPIHLRFPRIDAALRRALDVLVSIIALIVLAPVLAVIALAI